MELNYTRIEVSGSWSEHFMSQRGEMFVREPPEQRFVDPAADLLALMDRDGIASAHVVVGGPTLGDSMIGLALERSDRVRSLTLVAWASGPLARDAMVDSEYVRDYVAQIEEWQELVAHGDVERFVDYLIEAGDYRMNQDFGRYIAREMLLDNISMFSPPLVQVRKSAGPAHERLAEVSRPVLAVIGEQMWSWQKEALHCLASRAPDGRAAVIPDARLYPNLDNPPSFNEAVLSFLADVDTRVAT